MVDTESILARDITRENLVAELKALRPAFRRAGVTRMALIGSRARCDNRQDSDIDLMIEVEPGRTFSLLDLIGIKHLIEDDVGLPTDMFMQRSLRPDFLARANRDKVEIF